MTYTPVLMYEDSKKLSLRVVVGGSDYEVNKHVTDFFGDTARGSWHWGNESPTRARDFMVKFRSSLMVFLGPNDFDVLEYYALQDQFDVYHSVFVPEDVDL